MATPRICVLRAPGTNCDLETAHAFELAGGAADRIHLFRLLEQPDRLHDYQILCIPGGFSYGDDVGAGVVLGSQLRGQLGESVRQYLESDKLVLGICNGFQTLLKSGILPCANLHEAPPATLTWNQNGRYTAVWVTLDVGPTNNVFLRGTSRLQLPVAHAEGRVAVRDAAIIDRWTENGQIALRYAQQDSDCIEPIRELPYPANPNGSIANIAGLSDPSGRVLGLMPHPERFLFPTQHPQWTRNRATTGEGAGLRLFRNAVGYFA